MDALEYIQTALRDFLDSPVLPSAGTPEDAALVLNAFAYGVLEGINCCREFKKEKKVK